MKEKLMSDLEFSNLQLFRDEQFKKGIYILLINADKTPPHIAVLANGVYYSLGVNGLRIVPYSSFKSYLEKRKSKNLFIELCIADLDFESEFSKYKNLTKEAKTCIFPLKHTLKQKLSFDEKAVNTIFDLMEVLRSSKSIPAVYERNINANSFTIKRYNLEDVFLRIQNLTNK